MPIFSAKDKFDCSNCEHGDKYIYPCDQSLCPLWKISVTKLAESVPKFGDIEPCNCDQYLHALTKANHQYIHEVEKDQYIDCIQQPCPFSLARSITKPTESYLPVSQPESKPLRVGRSKTPSKATTPAATSPPAQIPPTLEVLPLEEDFDCTDYEHAVIADTGKYTHLVNTHSQYCWEQPCTCWVKSISDPLEVAGGLLLCPCTLKPVPPSTTPEPNFADQLSTALTFPEMSTPASPSPAHTPLEYLPSRPHTPPALSTMATPVDPQYIQVLQRLTDALDGLTIAPGPVSQIWF
ncbi:hypothetical protein DL96DRAFT_1703124 [Flagelloscypha sp. PMI_526]|nr:hypothetical protein DL96DRAFT_1703124 [Flagelloscypha sp. PMI_526]